MFTKIHPTYKENLLAAINRYLSSKPQHSLERLEDMVNLRKLIESDYEDHVALVLALKKYAETINTGFYLFGIEKFHIKTGHSRLKQYMEEAISSMSLSSLQEWDAAYKTEAERTQRSETDSAGSFPSEEFLARLQNLEEENSRLKQERILLDETCRQMILQYNRLKVSFETLQASYQEKHALLDKLIDENHQLREAQQGIDSSLENSDQERDGFEDLPVTPLFSVGSRHHRPMFQ